MIPAGYTALADGTIIGKQGRPLKPTPNTRGYLKFPAWVDGKRLTFQVHAVVCETFHGPRPTPEHQARHLNGDKLDNRAGNVAWGTPAENTADKVRHGTLKVALTEQQVRSIRRQYATGGLSLRDLAVEYGVSKKTISVVVNRKQWKHVV